MGLLYETREWKGHGKNEYYHNEYRQDGNIIKKFKCRIGKFFDGKENNWESSEKLIDSWTKNDPNMPEWLKKLVK